MAVSGRVETSVPGYLPNDTPPPLQLVLFGLQHVITMFPATVFVALFVGFHVSTVLLASGISTIVALFGSRYSTGKFIPLYYGSSFSYLAALSAVTGAVPFGPAASDEKIALAQTGIVVTGIINILVGLLIRFAGGKKTIDKLLPPVVTGSVAAVIGFALGFAALGLASSSCCWPSPAEPFAPNVILTWWLVAIVTLLSTIAFSVYLQGKGFIGMIPILLGAIVGYIVAIPLGLVNFAPIQEAALFAPPVITFPSFSGDLAATAIFGIGIMAIATIPESTAHLYQISLYVDHLADQQKRPKYRLSEFIGINLVLDGIGDAIGGLIGGTAGTNYGENNSLMAITRNYSGPALMAAGVIAILMSFVGVLEGGLRTIPNAVSGGLAIYLFGVIGMQGIALMQAEKVNLFDPRQLAVGATIMVVGIGGHIGYNGFLPIPLLTGIFPQGWPAIATAALLGILINLVFTFFPAPAMAGEKTVDSMEDIAAEDNAGTD
jgi:uracil permease